ncbi:nucleotidyltransferase domain-containing protein [Clostridium sp. CX1]|uniref:nucleotidyltransferase domain-containing protein n=1 Tax=Clostridium sp. CX1 TaxID=2978346 RepID=UPI0021C195BA|nr:nucleotidyltransferase domain-containing protein [Clostridium sp. CX1]MCT8978553.1 nucleotidyltransferase domain-containing protein [Clostridium sp. CX1]
MNLEYQTYQYFVAKGIFKADSDIDLCIIKNTNNKRHLLAEMYVEIESSIPFDLILYTEAEWDECVDDKNSFAYVINNTGVKIYG